jgi:superfamily II DNA/RNA helicase
MAWLRGRAQAPRDVTAFIHRAGRTARKGQPGVLTCLIKPFEQPFYDALREGEGAGSALQVMSGRDGRAVSETERQAPAPSTLQSPEQRRARGRENGRGKAARRHDVEAARGAERRRARRSGGAKHAGAGGTPA